MSIVSIIVPVYNVTAYFPKTVQSICTQTAQNIEIILVDDGSTDGSGTLCDEFAAADNRIRVVHKENGGLSSARNAGLDAASGDYIMFVDGDDYLVPNAVELLLDVAARHGAFDFIQFHYAETDGSWTADERQAAHDISCSDPREMFRYLYKKGGVAASACTKLYRRVLFDGLRFQLGISHEDEQLITHLLPRCKNVIYTDLVLYGYVMREGSIIHAAFQPSKMDIFPIMDERIDVLKSYGLHDLILETQKKQFITAAGLYCSARKSGFQTEAALLKGRLKTLSMNKQLPLSGQYKLLFVLTKLNRNAVAFYYQLRCLLRKTM